MRPDRPGNGYRFLDEDEYYERAKAVPHTELWSYGDQMWKCNVDVQIMLSSHWLYRTKLTREQLAKYESA